MLAGAGLGDDSPLPHPHRQQPLAERVVDLVGAGVAEIFPLEPDLGAAGEFGESLGEEQGGGPAHEGREQAVEFGCERRVGHRLGIGPLQLVERRGKRFGNVAAAESAEAAVGVGHAGHGRGGCGAGGHERVPRIDRGAESWRFVHDLDRL